MGSILTLWSMAFVPCFETGWNRAWGTANLLSRWTCNHARISNEKPALLHLRARNWNRLVNLGKKKAGGRWQRRARFEFEKECIAWLELLSVCDDPRSSNGKFLMMKIWQFLLLRNFSSSSSLIFILQTSEKNRKECLRQFFFWKEFNQFHSSTSKNKIF